MDRYEKLWGVVVSARQAAAILYTQRPVPREKRQEWSMMHGRAFFAALADFFGDQDVFVPDVPYFEPGGKIDTRSLSSLREAPDQQVVVRLAADMISVDMAPMDNSLIPEMDLFKGKLKKAILR